MESKEIKYAFSLYDKDFSGYLKSSQLKDFLADLGFDSEDPFYHNLILEFRKNEKFSFATVLQFVNDLQQTKQLIKRCRQVFNQFDYSGSGVILESNIAEAFFLITEKAPMQRKLKIAEHVSLLQRETIDVIEFQSLIALLLKSKTPRDVLFICDVIAQYAFNAIDTKCDGHVSTNHAKNLLEFAMWRKPYQKEEDFFRWNKERKISFNELFYFIKEATEKDQKFM